MGQAETKLEDRYHLQKVKLGQGSFGVVWRAVDKSNQDVVAIKQLDKSRMPKRGVSREDVEREVRIMMACRHLNILGLLGTFEDDKNVYLALEYCDGGDFGDKVKERGQNLQEDEAVRWMQDIVAGVAALHQKGICHRDIKPDNFMVKGSVGSQCIKLADFGLAVFLPARRQLLTQKCGTPAFMSPEVHLLPGFSRGYSLPCDVWAIGVILSMLMHGGQHPFADTTGQIDTNALLSGSVVSAGLFNGLMRQGPVFSDEARQLCKKMLDPNPESRSGAEDALRSPWFRLRVSARPGERKPSVQLPLERKPSRDGTPGRQMPQVQRVPTGSPKMARSPSGGIAFMGKLMQAMVDGGDSSPQSTPASRERNKAQAVVSSPKRSPMADGRRKPPAMPSPAVEYSPVVRKDHMKARDGRGPSGSPRCSPLAGGSPVKDQPTPCRVPSQPHIRF